MSLAVPGVDVQTDPLDGLRIVDCDAHLTEPPDLWTSRVAASQQDLVPVLREVEGRTYWVLNGEVWASAGGNTITWGAKKLLGTHTMARFEDIDPSAWSVPDRLKLLDSLGIEAQILYPNAVGFASNHVFAIEDEAQRQLVLQTFNDYYVDVQEAGEGRLFPQPMLPVWDMDLTVKEMTRLLDRGVTGFTLSDKPEHSGVLREVDVDARPAHLAADRAGQRGRALRNHVSLTALARWSDLSMS